MQFTMMQKIVQKPLNLDTTYTHFYQTPMIDFISTKWHGSFSRKYYPSYRFLFVSNEFKCENCFKYCWPQFIDIIDEKSLFYSVNKKIFSFFMCWVLLALWKFGRGNSFFFHYNVNGFIWLKKFDVFVQSGMETNIHIPQSA